MNIFLNVILIFFPNLRLVILIKNVYGGVKAGPDRLRTGWGVEPVILNFLGLPWISKFQNTNYMLFVINGFSWSFFWTCYTKFNQQILEKGITFYCKVFGLIYFSLTNTKFTEKLFYFYFRLISVNCYMRWILTIHMTCMIETRLDSTMMPYMVNYQRKLSSFFSVSSNHFPSVCISMNIGKHRDAKKKL